MFLLNQKQNVNPSKEVVHETFLNFSCRFLDNLMTYENNLKVRDNSNVNYYTIIRKVNEITNFARTG